MPITRTEPVLSAGTVTAVAVAVVAVLVAFGVPMTDDQQVAVLALVGVVAPIIVAVVARRLVTPNDKVPAQIETLSPSTPADPLG